MFLRRLLPFTALLLLLTALLPAATDDQIYDKVRIDLANDRDVKGGAIEVKVSQGVVELTGNVRSEKQRLKAEKVARKVKGVQKVINNLKISGV